MLCELVLYYTYVEEVHEELMREKEDRSVDQLMSVWLKFEWIGLVQTGGWESEGNKCDHYYEDDTPLCIFIMGYKFAVHPGLG